MSTMFSIRFLDVTATLVKELSEWQSAGEQRSVEIEFEPIARNEGEQMLQIWCFDKEVGAGCYVTCAEDLHSYEDIVNNGNFKGNGEQLTNALQHFAEC